MNDKEDLVEELQTNLIKESGKLKELHAIAKEQLALATEEASFEMDERCRSEHESTTLLTSECSFSSVSLFLFLPLTREKSFEKKLSKSFEKKSFDKKVSRKKVSRKKFRKKTFEI